jgi:hypothetical protein
MILDAAAVRKGFMCTRRHSRSVFVPARVALTSKAQQCEELPTNKCFFSFNSFMFLEEYAHRLVIRTAS